MVIRLGERRKIGVDDRPNVMAVPTTSGDLKLILSKGNTVLATRVLPKSEWTLEGDQCSCDVNPVEWATIELRKLKEKGVIQ